MKTKIINLLGLESIYLLRYGKTSKYKIGISKDVNRRLKEVDSALKDRKVSIIRSIYVFNAKKLENKLHERFKNDRFNFLKAGRKGGKTEWFDFNFLESFFVIWVFDFIVLKQIAILVIIFAFVYLLIIN